MILIANEDCGAGFDHAVALLASGCGIIDAIETTLRAAEDDLTSTSVGPNGLPNAAGIVELDAGLMEGATRRIGAVAALRGSAHPISVARGVLERTSYNLLVGEGALRFAREFDLGFDGICPALDSDVSRGDEPLLDKSHQLVGALESHDTAIVIGIDASGHIAAGTSTSGLAGKYPGRVGDSPIAGAGYYAANGIGAAACVGLGEMTMRCATARILVERLAGGMEVRDAVMAALEDLRDLRGGLIGGVTVFAIDAHGGHAVGSLRGLSGSYCAFDGDEGRPRRREIDLFVP